MGNDAVAITLFDGCAKLVTNEKPLDGAAIGELTGDFCITWFGSVALGVGIGLLAALLLKFARLGGFSDEDHFHFNVPEMGVVLVMAYLPFLIAEATDILSPIVAVLFAGITMRHYAHYNLTIMTRQVFLPTVELIANLCETYAFLLLGLGVFLLTSDYSAPLILCAIVGCLIARAVFVYPFGVALNATSKATPMTRKELHVVCWASWSSCVHLLFAISRKSELPEPKCVAVHDHGISLPQHGVLGMANHSTTEVFGHQGARGWSFGRISHATLHREQHILR